MYNVVNLLSLLFDYNISSNFIIRHMNVLLLRYQVLVLRHNIRINTLNLFPLLAHYSSVMQLFGLTDLSKILSLLLTFSGLLFLFEQLIKIFQWWT